MARSAPRASASRITCATRAGPAEQTTTSPPCFSFSRSASSSAYASGSFISKLASASRIQVLSSLRRGCHSRVGTCLMQTAIFIGGDLVIGLSGYLLMGLSGYLVIDCVAGIGYGDWHRHRHYPMTITRLPDDPMTRSHALLSKRLKSSAALVPPKPNEFDSA